MTPTRSHLDTLIAEFERIARALVAALVAGQLTLAEFDSQFRAQIRVHHLAAAALANNGRVPEGTRAVQQVIDEQLRYFDRWMTGLYVGTLPPEGLAALLEQYAQAEQPKHQNDNTLIPLVVGVGTLLATHALKNALTPENTARLGARAASYGASLGGTLAQAEVSAQGLPTLPFYPRDGLTICRYHCCCSWRIVEKGAGDFDCYYELNEVCPEHCATCLYRARIANPLRVRNGVIMQPERYQEAALYA